MAKRRKASRRGRHGRHGRRRGLVVLLCLMALAFAAVAAILLLRPAPERNLAASVVMKMGSRGQGAGQLDSPRGVAVDSQGSVYVVDMNNSRVVKYDAQGKALLQFGGKGDNPPKSDLGKFNEPSGVAVDAQGFVYVADAWNGRIQKFDQKGKPLMEFGGSRFQFYSPRNVALDMAGNMFVADTGNSMVKVISPDGRRIKDLGGQETFREVFGVAVNSRGEVFAADPGNGKIHKFSPMPDSAEVKSVKVAGWQENNPFWPHLARDSKDRIYAVDQNHRKLWVYDSNLKYLGTIGGEGNEIFAAPMGLAINAQDEVFVSEMNNGQVVKLSRVDFPMQP